MALMIHLYAHFEHLEGKKKRTTASVPASYATHEYKLVKRGSTEVGQLCHASFSRRAGERQLGPGSGALGDDAAAEAEELGRATAGRRGDTAGLLDETLLVDETAEILLVETPPGERLDGALKLEQGEAR